MFNDMSFGKSHPPRVRTHQRSLTTHPNFVRFSHTTNTPDTSTFEILFLRSCESPIATVLARSLRIGIDPAPGAGPLGPPQIRPRHTGKHD